MGAIRVLIADDHAILRAGLKALVSNAGDMTVVGEAATGEEALCLARETNPHVISLDLSMPRVGGIRALEKLRSACPRARVVVLSMHDDLAYFRAAWAAGCAGYMVKTAALADYLTALRTVARGETFVDPVLRPLLEGGGTALHRCQAAEGPPADTLSARERQVLHLLARGDSYQRIADHLFLSIKTVETYRTRLGQKLGLRTRADLIRYALEVGLLGPGGVPPESNPI